MSWLLPRTELTVAQARAVTLSPEAHRLISGSPGSGKTMVLLHRARYLRDRFRVPPERYRIFVFTRTLKAYIRDALDDLDLPDTSVMTFDAWCLEFFKSRINKRLPRAGDTKAIDFKAVHRAVWDKTRSFDAKDRLFDFVLVDEGQDLEAHAFEVLTAVAHHVTVLMDHKQQLYETGTDEPGILRALGLRRHNLSLLDAYRCSPFIVQTAAAFVRDARERDAFIAQHPSSETSRQTPLLYLAKDGDDEREHLIEMVRDRVDKNERIAILFPTKRHVYGYARALFEAGLEVEVPGPVWRARRGRPGARGESLELPEIDFKTPLPKLMPYPSAKGLTFDSVLMPRLIPGLFGKGQAALFERWLFVGITRASQWVYFSTINDNTFVLLDQFKQLEARYQISIQLTYDLLSALGTSAPEVSVTGETGTEGLEDLF